MRVLPALCFFLLMAACNKPLPQIASFDLEAWRKDTDGCTGFRAQHQAALEAEAMQMRGLSQMQIVHLLGKPDQNELYKRNQKFFYYWISGSPACTGKKAVRRLSVRFNAMGYAKEILIE